jgi:GNAT superfamily N-acetyltransferase
VTGGSLVVRRLQPDDWQVLRDIRLTALADSPSAFASTLAREEAFTEADWRGRLANGCRVVVTDGAHGEPVGLAGGYLHDGESELIAMWVHPDVRGGGAAEQLVEAVADWAREQETTRLRLWVVEGNDRAERVYRRLGFAHTGAAQPVPGNPSLTEVQMERLLTMTE